MSDTSWKKINGNVKAAERTWKGVTVGDEVSGLLVDIKRDTGADGTGTVYSLQQEDGSITAVWGTDNLNRNIKDSDIGKEVKIEYQGLQKNPKTSRSYHAFDIYTR